MIIPIPPSVPTTHTSFNMNRPNPPPPIDMNKQQQQQQRIVISEEEFMLKYPTPVTVYVRVPNDPSFSSWNLNGQEVSITLSVTSTVKEAKEMMSLQLGGMPVNKQQLKERNSTAFCKDVETLAKLNIGQGARLELIMKLRGKR